MNLLQTVDLQAGYGQTRVLHGVTLTVERGSVHALLGRNGVGKTTLAKTVMGLIDPTHGIVRTLGADTTARPAFEKARTGIAYVPQDFGTFDDLSVAENLRLGTPDLRDIRDDRSSEVFEYFPVLWERLAQRAGTLSGGERKMLMMGRALLRRPDLLVVDEVTEGVQPSIIDRISEALVAQVERGAGVLLIEQRLEFALDKANHFSVMHAGEIVAEGPVKADTRDTVERHMVLT